MDSTSLISKLSRIAFTVRTGWFSGLKSPMQGGKERNRFECTIYIVPLSCRKAVYVFIGTSNITKLFDIDNIYSFEYQKNRYILYGIIQEG